MLRWLWLIVLVLGAVQVSGIDICGDIIDSPANCTMVTPEINCTTYNYTVLNQSGDVLENGSLSPYFGSVYQFQFVQDIGSYVVVLCDGAVRDVEVKEGDSVILAAVLLLPLLFGFLIMLGAVSLDSEKHSVLKIFLFMLSFVMFWVSLHFGLLAVVKYFDFPELQDLIGSVTYWSWWVFAVIIMYWLIYGFVTAINVAAQKKKERLQY